MKKIGILFLKAMRNELFIPMLSSITWPIVEKNLMMIIQKTPSIKEVKTAVYSYFLIFS
ncbi:hypothetical protein [Cytobacillus pseudoceanisediminis]